MSEFTITNKNRVKRHPERGAYDKPSVFRIIDEALICHVAFVQDNQPFVIPTLHARQNESILLHGASSSRLMRHIEAGQELCLAFTLVDGLVLARSAFSHSVNYRSVILFGRGKDIVSSDEKLAALERFTERIEDPRKIWKLSPMDLESHRRWYDYSRARDAMFEATDTEESPWYVVDSHIQRRGRLNCIAHLLSLIPYEEVPREKVKLPKRQPKGDYVETDHPFRWIPEIY